MNCKHCKGEGWVWNLDISEDCSWCKGTGKLDKPHVRANVELPNKKEVTEKLRYRVMKVFHNVFVFGTRS